MAAETTVQQIIDSALSSAQQAQDSADSYANDAIDFASSIAIPNLPPEIGEITVPSLDPPEVDLGELAEGESNAKADEIKTMLETELADFLATYFPCGWITKMQTVCDKLHDWIKNGGTGLNDDIEAGIWDRGRQRINRMGEKADEAGAGVAASRGWSVPPASVTRRQMAMEQDELNRDSQYSLDVAIKQAELEQSNIRFAITNAISLYTSVMQAALNFLNAKLRAEALGQAYASLLEQATRNFYTQALQYYRAQLQGEELEFRQDVADVERSLAVTRIGVEQIVRRARLRTDAAMAGARVMGDIAASARSTTNTMASVVHETTKEE